LYRSPLSSACPPFAEPQFCLRGRCSSGWVSFLPYRTPDAAPATKGAREASAAFQLQRHLLKSSSNQRTRRACVRAFLSFFFFNERIPPRILVLVMSRPSQLVKHVNFCLNHVGSGRDVGSIQSEWILPVSLITRTVRWHQGLLPQHHAAISQNNYGTARTSLLPKKGWQSNTHSMMY